MLAQGNIKILTAGAGLVMVGPAIIHSLGRIGYVIAKEVIKGGLFTYAVVAGTADAVYEFGYNMVEEAEAELEGRDPHYLELPPEEEAALKNAEEVVEHGMLEIVETVVLGV